MDRRVSAAAAGATEIGRHKHRGDDVSDKVGEGEEVRDHNGFGDSALVLEEDDRAVVSANLGEGRTLDSGEVGVRGNSTEIRVDVVGGEDVVVDELLLDVDREGSQDESNLESGRDGKRAEGEAWIGRRETGSAVDDSNRRQMKRARASMRSEVKNRHPG